MRWSQYYIPTLREAPSDAEAISHQLMMRAGMIRKIASGIYSFLPLGWRVLQKMSNIIREEMNRAGAMEVSLPVVQPKELWEEAGRWQRYGKELARLTDRHDHEFCLQATSEEAIVDMVRRDLQSYKQLPVNFYQIQTKFRDEIRPRFGLMRGREFLMKDAYSFDLDETSARQSYQVMREAYRRIFKRTGLNFRAVEADTGAIGGDDSEEFMVLADTGEDEIISCQSCEYAANQEKAVGKAEAKSAEPMEYSKASDVFEFETPGLATIEDLAKSLDERPENLLKTMIATDSESRIYVVLLRGSDELHELKLSALLSKAYSAEGVRLASDEELSRWQLPKGSLGPYHFPKEAQIICDDRVSQVRAHIVGANKQGFHLKNVLFGRDFKAHQVGCIRRVMPGEACSKCEGRLISSRGIEVGHVFYLGQKYSKAMNLTVKAESGKDVFVEMGCFGIGVGRTAAACIEQNYDEQGIRWPLGLAPFSICVSSLDEGQPKDMAQKLYDHLIEEGIDVIWDDRKASAGVKLKDADLVGFPLQVIFGKRSVAEGFAEFKERSSGKKTRIELDRISTHVVSRLRELEAEVEV